MGIARFFLAVGIAIIFSIFICYGISVIYEAPKNNMHQGNSCYQTYNCQKQADDCYMKSNQSYDLNYESCVNNAYQSEEYQTCQEKLIKCNENYEKESPDYKYSRNVFFILFSIGIISIIVGISLTGLQGIGSGLIGGGVLIVVYSLFVTYRYWHTFNKYVKLGALAIVLIILIYFGYKKIEKKLQQPSIQP